MSWALASNEEEASRRVCDREQSAKVDGGDDTLRLCADADDFELERLEVFGDFESSADEVNPTGRFRFLRPISYFCT